MAYTVKKISTFSGVSVRTLHYYEEIGILTPTFYGENGYRYYEEKELFTLQQILFFKELGLTLKEIRKILHRNDFDRLKALYSHKHALRKKQKKIGELLKTIDKTIHHLEGKTQMKDKEIYQGFYDWAEGKGEESYFFGKVQDATSDEEMLVLKSVKENVSKNWKKEDYEKHVAKGHAIFRKIAQFIEEGKTPDSLEVQKAIEEHFAYAKQFHHLTKDVYAALATLYAKKWKKQILPFHPKLPSFMAKGMKRFCMRL